MENVFNLEIIMQAQEVILQEKLLKDFIPQLFSIMFQ